jgi:hypothetical protein
MLTEKCGDADVRLLPHLGGRHPETLDYSLARHDAWRTFKCQVSSCTTLKAPRLVPSPDLFMPLHQHFAVAVPLQGSFLQSPAGLTGRLLTRSGVVAVALALTACATTAPPQPAPATPALEQLLAEAAKARQEGAVAKERESYHAAAKAYPASKEPWRRLSESYFQAGDYGHAILAAQEVAQRDPADELATGVLAVSGLRVSTSALATLRQQQRLNTDTRAHAEDVVKSLRELLGEPVLVPKPADVVVPVPALAPAPARKVRRLAKPVASPVATGIAATPPAPAAARLASPSATNPVSAPAPAARANPFDKLK